MIDKRSWTEGTLGETQHPRVSSQLYGGILSLVRGQGKEPASSLRSTTSGPPAEAPAARPWPPIWTDRRCPRRLTHSLCTKKTPWTRREWGGRSKGAKEGLQSESKKACFGSSYCQPCLLMILRELQVLGDSVTWVFLGEGKCEENSSAAVMWWLLEVLL